MSKVSRHITDGLMWQNTEGKWCKRCPKCGRDIIGKDGTTTTKFNVSHSIIIGKVCHSCIKIGKPTWSSLHREEMSKIVGGKNHHFYGKRRSDEFREWQRKRVTGTKLTDEVKDRLSEASRKAWKDPEKRKKMIHTSKWNNVSVDKGQMEMIRCWNGIGFHFIPNYQVKNGLDLFYLDGYDKEREVALEYDSKYHSRVHQKQKDLIRQEKIIDILHPRKFWRYNSVNKTFTDVISGKKQGAAM